jgi:putative nucleotidyltransferase with HDIG domain
MRQALPKTAEPARGSSPENSRARSKFEIARLLELEPARQELMARLQTAVDPKDFASLVQEGFTTAAEQAVRELVGSEMSRMLVADRELLSGERERSVMVRPLPEGAPGGELVADIGGIPDLAAARADADRWALDLPGNWPLPVRKALGHLARGALRPNLTYNSAETERQRQEAARAVKPVLVQIQKGERVLAEGERIEPRHLTLLRALRAKTHPGDLAQARAGAALFAALMIFATYKFGRRQLPEFKPMRRDALFSGLVLLATLLLARAMAVGGALLADRWGALPLRLVAWAVPFAAGAMLLRLVLSAEVALLYAVVAASLFGLLEGGQLSMTLLALAGSMVGAEQVGRTPNRLGILKAGFRVGLCGAALTGCFALLDGRLLAHGTATAAEVATAFVSGAVLCPLLVLALAPLVDAVFGYTTDLRLQELASLNHPALKELIVKAPGTYHHSIITAGLAENAAQAIGANPLLARVSAYYHDLGKGKNPLAFEENSRGPSRHDSLDPEQSAALIRRHVADGLELARHYHLPRAVAQAIPQHHGTRRMEEFYRKALDRYGPEVDERPFRYPGPLPQSREVALVMLADAVEAASRLAPRGESSDRLVHRVMDGVVAEGQLQDCPLTLHDLTLIARSFQATLDGLGGRAGAGSSGEPRPESEATDDEPAVHLN